MKENLRHSVRNEFLDIIRDLSSYLEHEKDAGNNLIKISKQSEGILKDWNRSGKKSSFLFQGSESSKFFIVDSSSLFFKEEAGKLLEKILKAMNLSSSDVFICNCSDENALKEKIDQIKPQVVICFGKAAATALSKTDEPLSSLRGNFFKFKKIPVMPTLHPSQLIKNPDDKRLVWEDMKKVMKLGGL